MKEMCDCDLCAFTQTKTNKKSQFETLYKYMNILTYYIKYYYKLYVMT